jgi:hypothetical protein
MNMRRLTAVVALVVVFLLPTEAHSQAVVHDPINAVHLIAQLAKLREQIAQAEKTYLMMADQYRTYRGLGRFTPTYIKGWTAGLVTGSSCSWARPWESAINAALSPTEAYNRVMRKAEYLGCLNDWSADYQSDLAKTHILDMANVNAIKTVGSSRSDVITVNGVITEQLSVAQDVSKTGRAPNANLQKIVINTATTGAQLRDLQRLNAAILEQLTIANQIQRDLLQAALNNEAERRQVMPAAWAFTRIPIQEF